MMMVRTQINLSAQQHRAAKVKAAELGISLAEYLRRLVERDVEGPEERYGDITRVFDLGSSGGSNVARHKDAYIEESIVAERGRR